eukprot:CAMPEP_0117677112 /NCGR_PEP_ID=MMETSP0804-20121206/16567_1 /TAXON_ID=1074897 /ORGANISM="Tetraselmis astigmatica, Strain CCMP880" /LENGTH=209 /DNA_ID=CAMNT_0005486365 /DNA_START=530 /DNA_END=1159 /DNA_ORIENTATION=-
MVIVSAEAAGISCRESREELAADKNINARLESIRREAAMLAGPPPSTAAWPFRTAHPVTSTLTAGVFVLLTQPAGLGDVSTKDSPKICIISSPAGPQPAQLAARYWVNPGRSEPHGGMAITGASCLAAACLTPGTEAARLSAPAGAPMAMADACNTNAGAARSEIQYSFEHPGGTTRVLMETGCDGELLACGYRSTARLLAEGICFPQV